MKTKSIEKQSSVAFYDPLGGIDTIPGPVGFSRVDGMGQEDINVQYFAGRADGLRWRLYRLMGVGKRTLSLAIDYML